MAACKECGKKLGFLQGADGLCPDCRLQSMRNNVLLERPLPIVVQQTAKMEKEAEDQRKSFENIILTTESTSDLKILRRIEIITAECAFGMHVFKDLFAGIRDIVGGRSEAVENTMRDARRTALFELRKEAYRVGANAVVGVSLNYVELGGHGSNMILLVSSGTAVELERQS